MEITTADQIHPGMTVQVLNYQGEPLAGVKHRHDPGCRCAPFVVAAVRSFGAGVDVFGSWDGDFRSFANARTFAVLA